VSEMSKLVLVIFLFTATSVAQQICVKFEENSSTWIKCGFPIGISQESEKDVEIKALYETIKSRDEYIEAQNKSIETWKELARAKSMSRGEKTRLVLSIAGSIAAVIGTIIGR